METDWTIIFNKTWTQWGTELQKVRRCITGKCKSWKDSKISQKSLPLLFQKTGKVDLLWGDSDVLLK